MVSTLLILQTVTADVGLTSLSIFAHLFHQSYHEIRPDVNDVCFQIQSLKGRLNFAVLTRERLVVVKLDGWPEVIFPFIQY